jgi:hypothetical protein
LYQSLIQNLPSADVRQSVSIDNDYPFTALVTIIMTLIVLLRADATPYMMLTLLLEDKKRERKKLNFCCECEGILSRLKFSVVDS